MERLRMLIGNTIFKLLLIDLTGNKLKKKKKKSATAMCFGARESMIGQIIVLLIYFQHKSTIETKITRKYMYLHPDTLCSFRSGNLLFLFQIKSGTALPISQILCYMFHQEFLNRIGVRPGGKFVSELPQEKEKNHSQKRF